jgi:NAD-dependent dihydropyrimidine dehydrogenase PreA subunit
MTDPERNVTCENCGEVLYTEPIGGPDDDFPELGDATRYVDPDDCTLCNPDDDA